MDQFTARLARFGERRREDWQEKRLLFGHSVAMLMNAWTKKKDGGMFTAQDVFPERATDEAADARAEVEGRRTLATFQAMALEQKRRRMSARD